MANDSSIDAWTFSGMFLNAIPSFIVFALSTIVIIIGWSVIYSNARKLASRAEIRGHLTILDSCLNELRQNAIEYYFEIVSSRHQGDHGKLNFANLKQIELIQQSTIACHKSSNILNYLQSYNFSSDDLSFKIQDIRQHITNPPVFDSKNDDGINFANNFWPWYLKLSDLCNECSKVQHDCFSSFFLDKRIKA